MSSERRPPDASDEFLTVAEVAAVLKLNQQTFPGSGAVTEAWRRYTAAVAVGGTSLAATGAPAGTDDTPAIAELRRDASRGSPSSSAEDVVRDTSPGPPRAEERQPALADAEELPSSDTSGERAAVTLARPSVREDAENAATPPVFVGPGDVSPVVAVADASDTSRAARRAA